MRFTLRLAFLACTLVFIALASFADEHLQMSLEEPAAAPYEAVLASPLSSMLQMFLALGVVIVLAYLVLHKGLGSFLKRQRSGGRIQIKERVALDAKQALVLVEIDGQLLLLGACDGNVQLISRLTKEE